VVGLDAKALDLLVRIAGPAYQRLVAFVVSRSVPAPQASAPRPVEQRVNGRARTSA
jgi:hypothetical protein